MAIGILSLCLCEYVKMGIDLRKQVTVQFVPSALPKK